MKIVIGATSALEEYEETAEGHSEPKYSGEPHALRKTRVREARPIGFSDKKGMEQGLHFRGPL